MNAKADTHYRKNSKGEWVICGHPTYVTVGEVEFRDSHGKLTTATVTKLGKEFRDSHGKLRVYGYMS